MKRFATPCYPARAFVANGLRAVSDARGQLLSIACSPTTSRNAATAALHTIPTMACASAAHTTQSRLPASARAEWPRMEEGEGAKFFPSQPPPTARVLIRGFFSHGADF